MLYKFQDTFDKVYNQVITPFFNQITDSRQSNSSYSLSDVLKSSFAMFSLKSPSLFSFQKRSKAEGSNLLKIFGISKIPSDNGIRKILDQVDSQQLLKAFPVLFNWLKQQNVLSDYTVLDNHLVVSLDGVEHFTSKNIECKHCMQRSHRDGTTSYFHSMLSAALVNPKYSEVFILDNEPILRQDGNKKNDCERNAAKRIFNRLQDSYAQENIIFTMDALYACAPIIGQISQNNHWKYIIGVTEKGHAYLMQQFDQLVEQGNIAWQAHKAKDGEYTFGYANGLQLNESNTERVNLLYCILQTKKGEEKVFSWVSNIELSDDCLIQIMRVARSRWKIENEVFNTLKNQNYNFEHNYGHGQNELCTNFALLMMMAFNVDQIQQRCSQIFQKLLGKLNTKIKVWESLKAVFKLVCCDSMYEIHQSIAEMYGIQLE